MNAPPNIDPVAAHSDSDVVHWLTNDTRDSRQADVASCPDLPSAMAWRPDHVGRRDARGRSC
jgi:hypothetical protein